MRKRKESVLAGQVTYFRRRTQFLHRWDRIIHIYEAQLQEREAKGHPAWKHMLCQFLEDPQTWLRQYHQRSISESVNSAFQRIFSKKLTRRAKSRRKTKILVRICDSNIKRFCYLNHLLPNAT